MLALRTHTTLWLGLVAIVLDIVLYYTVGNRQLLLWLNVLMLAIAVVASASWTPAVLGAFRNGAKKARDKITVSIWGSWTILVLQRFYALLVAAYTVIGPDSKPIRPEWLTETPINSIVVTMLIIMGMYVSYATVSDDDLPEQDRTWTLISTFIGGLVAGGVGVFLWLSGINFP